MIVHSLELIILVHFGMQYWFYESWVGFKRSRFSNLKIGFRSKAYYVDPSK